MALTPVDSAAGVGSAPGSSYSDYSYTTTSGSDKVLIISAWHGAETVSSLTFNGAAATLVATGSLGKIYAIAAPDIGTYNIRANLSGAAYSGARFVVQEWDGAGTVTSEAVVDASTTAPSSGSITCPSGGAVAAFVNHSFTSSLGISAGTLADTATTSGAYFGSGYRTTTGAVTFSATDAYSSTVFAVSIQASSSGTDAAASGVTVTSAASIIVGSATGQAAATASGATVTAAASLIAGNATGEVLGTLAFNVAGLEFGRRTGAAISTFALDAGASYRYTVHADALTLGAAIITSAAITLDSNGRLPNLASTLIAPGTTYRIVAIRQADGEAATFRLTAS